MFTVTNASALLLIGPSLNCYILTCCLYTLMKKKNIRTKDGKLSPEHIVIILHLQKTTYQFCIFLFQKLKYGHNKN